MNVYLIVIVAYSLGLIALGWLLGKRVGGVKDFFVAGRALGPGLMFSTMLAANIGAGSTVGATALAYTSGVAAWWWVGSAALGSVVLAFWIGPAIRREAVAHDLRTVGDYLEYRYDASVRAVVSALLWIASVFILAGQLFAIFYTLLVVILFVPIVAGLYVRRTSTAAAFASIAGGVGGMLIIHVVTGGRGWRFVTPAFGGLVAAILAWAIALALSGSENSGHTVSA